MKYTFSFVSIIVLISLIGCQTESPSLLPAKTVTDTYHGIKVEDPYRYIEDLKDSTVLDWLKKQNLSAKEILNGISERQNIMESLKAFDQMQSSKITGLKIAGNDRHFYLKRGAKDNEAKLCYRESFDKAEVLFFDPKDFKPGEDTEYIINYIEPDWAGKHIVVSLSEKGKEISEMIVFDVETRERLPQIIDHCWPSATGGIKWLSDNSGFIYIHLPEIDSKSDDFLLNTSSVVYRLGDDPKNLHEIFSNSATPDVNIKPADFPAVFFEDTESKYLLGKLAGVNSFWDAYVAPLPNDIYNAKLSWEPLYKAEDQVKKTVVIGDSLIFTSAKGTPNFQIGITSLKNPDFDDPKILVKEIPDEVITDFEVTSRGIFYSTTRNGIEAFLYRYDKGVSTPIKLPEVSGSLSISSKGVNFPDLWVVTKGWTSNGNRYTYEVTTDTFTQANLVKSKELPGVKDLIIDEVVVKSHDGVEIPLSLIYRKGLKKNGKTPVLFRGYGAYGYSMKPTFSSSLYAWIKEGGIYAVAHVRGGGEKGNAWHEGGYKITKPNTWKDLIACIEYTIDQGYTSPEHTAIWSASAGGILIGRTMTERPDLLGAAIAEVGSMNLVRSEIQPNGPNNIKEFGSVKDSTGFRTLLEMDSYHHIKKGEKYPATLITAGMNDPRVVAWDPAKFAARLQAANSSDTPILFAIDFESGHGRGDSKAKEFERLADVLAFALWQIK
ncbi:prolyl oligopeptidase family serine peptidase [Sinomicrobium sp. M5D2P17]